MKIRYIYNQHRYGDHSDTPRTGYRVVKAATEEDADAAMYAWRDAINDGEKRPLAYPWVGIIHFPGIIL